MEKLTDKALRSIKPLDRIYNVAVAIHPEVQALDERRSLAGDLTIQVFVDLAPLLPVPDRSWSAAA